MTCLKLFAALNEVRNAQAIDNRFSHRPNHPRRERRQAATVARTAAIKTGRLIDEATVRGGRPSNVTPRPRETYVWCMDGVPMGYGPAMAVLPEWAVSSTGQH